MNNIPSKRVMLITYTLLLVYFSADYFSRAKSEVFALNFDWDNKNVIQAWDGIKIDSLSYDLLAFRPPDNFSPDPYFTYNLSLDNRAHYFRFIYSNKYNNTLTFKGLVWLNGTPKDHKGEYLLQKVELNHLPAGGQRIMTIGDRQLVNNEAKYFRKKLAAKGGVDFIGRTRDVYDYAHEAATGKSILELKAEKYRIEDAEFYILFFGEKEVNLELQEVKEAYEDVINSMLKKQGVKKIILISLPAYSNQISTAKRIAYNQELKRIADISSKVYYIDTDLLFQTNFDKYFRLEGSELSRAGYEKLANETEKMLKQ